MELHEEEEREVDAPQVVQKFRSSEGPVGAAVVADGQGGDEEAEDEEGLGGGLVLDVELDGVLEEVGELGGDLGEEEAEEDGGVGLLVDGVEVGGDAELGDVDHGGADVLGAVDAELDGEGLEAEGAVALDGLEVVDDGDAEPGEGVGHGQRDDGRRELAEHGVAAPPRQGDVRRAQREAATPALGLQLEGRRRVEVGDDRAEDRDGQDRMERIS
mmetsp:Transcript_24319/g.75058  ORF Transcript_24319/g.75058 Transcript_24319/m.75058 type:complete len:215 (-) Transcript_24319:615-1259(-)